MCVLQQFGEITGKEVNLSVPELVVQYRARQHAEHALHAARNYSDRTLSVRGGGGGNAPHTHTKSSKNIVVLQSHHV